MSVPLMPDVERLVQDALIEYLPSDLVGSDVYVSPPSDWAEKMPLFSITWRGGASTKWPERLQVSDMNIKAYALERSKGSKMIRLAHQALKEACLDHFSNKGVAGVETPGVLSHVKVISPAGIEYEGLTSKHPDSVMFASVFRITSAPTIT